ncbi:MAG: GDP-mannose 4,6-dehydratase [Deltaproteobacteria bacterium]|nr:GDP-mannose 4,6-dehydratase [Deltaproteobacteria bacterium]
MRALVTGACGFVGRHLIEHLLECGDEVFGCDYTVPAEAPACPLEQFDITSGEECAEKIRRIKPDIIYHLAGVSFVPEAEDDFKKALLANVLGTNHIFRICHLLQSATKVVFISSAEVYGKIAPHELPVTESQPISPANNYSLSKAMAELVAKRYGELGQVPYVIARPFNHIGPGQNERFVASSFALQLARVVKGKAPPVINVGNLEARRDFSDVRDIVRAYRLAALKGSGAYNLGSGRSVPIREILDCLVLISKANVEIREDPSRMRAAEVPEIYGSFSRAQRELGWKPQHSLQETLKDVYNWWLSRI